jgi:aspartate--ammonia ligase
LKIDLIIPENYKQLLDIRETERAIRLIKEFYQTNLAFELNLMRVTAPLFVKSGTGINDDLNGIEKPVRFNIKSMKGCSAEIVHSLAKWKRMMLADFEMKPGEGIYTDMNAIRPDENLDNLHSLYVDQWDWEQVITEKERNLEYLKKIVSKIYDIIRRTEKYVCHYYKDIEPILPENITFVHSEDLEKQYPDLTPGEREKRACMDYRAIFVIGIGAELKNGKPHDGRAPDYDDWSTPTSGNYKGLNGDIVLYYPVLDCAYELSSMGIRVDAKCLLKQLIIRGEMQRRDLYFHQRLLNGELPLSIGGGIGQSRLCMFFLRKAHIGEIQSSIWPENIAGKCKLNNIFLL